MRVSLALVAVSILGRIAWLAGGGNGVAIEVLTPLRMDGLALGSWLALGRPQRQRPGLAGEMVPPGGHRQRPGGRCRCGCSTSGLMGLPYTLWALLFGSLLVLWSPPRPGLAGPLRQLAGAAVLRQVQLRNVRLSKPA